MPSLRELKVSSWKDLLAIVDPLSSRKPNEVTYIFRGQVDNGWKLKPTLLRISAGKSITEILRSEQFALHTFRSNVIRLSRQEDLPPHLPHQPIAEWWALMQHHYTPTRLLDFTASPYVGIYFAAESQWEHDGCLYILHRGPIENHAKTINAPSSPIDFDAYLQSEGAREAIRAYIPNRQTERFAAQQGLFIYGDNVTTDVESLLEALYLKDRAASLDGVLYEKIIIPASLKRECMIKLRAMNIGSQTLFPGIDGLGRNIAEGLRIGVMMT